MGSASFSDPWRFNGTELTGEVASTLTVAKAPSAIEPNSAVVVSYSVCSVTNCPGTAAIKLTGSTVIISFSSVSNKYYRLERTDDLGGNRWVTVADSIPGTRGIVQVADVGGAGHPSRFYRVVLLPDNVPPQR